MEDVETHQRRRLDGIADTVSSRIAAGPPATILDRVAIGVAEVASDGRLLMVNLTLGDMLGCQPEALTGRRLREIAHPEDRAEVENSLRALAVDGEARIRLDSRLLHQNGSYVLTRITMAAVLRGEHGSSAVLSIEEESPRPAFAAYPHRPPAANADVDPELVDERLSEILESEARLRALIEASPLGITILDLHGNPIFYNPKARELHDLTVEEAIDHGWGDAVHPDDRERVTESWREAATGGRSWFETYRFLHRNGTVVWVSGRAAPIRVDGRMIGFVGTLEDISRLKDAERALRDSEEQFRALANSIPQLSWVAEPGGEILWFNDRWYEYIGPATSPDAWDWASVQHPDHAERVLAGMRHALATAEPWEDTFPMRGRAGEFRWFLSRALPVRNSRGEVVQWFGTHTDVTAKLETARLRERLLDQEREARNQAEGLAREEQALREAAAAVSASNSTGEVIRQIALNAVMATNADAALVERIDAHASQVIIEATAGGTEPSAVTRIPYVGSLAEQVVRSGKAMVISQLSDVSNERAAGLLPLEAADSVIVVPLIGGSGEPIGALIFLRDAGKEEFREDEIRRVQIFADLASLAFRRIHLLEEAERRAEDLRRVMESRARLIRGFSHDLKNPLGAADGFLALFEDGIFGEITPEQETGIGRARRSIRNTLDLIEDLLDLARAEAGQVEIRWRAVDLREAVRQLEEEYRVQAAARGLSLEISLADDLPVIESDASRVRQVLGNLLSNAVKYTDEGGVQVKVESRIRDGETEECGWVAAEVTDTGPGIPLEKQELLFQEFARLDTRGKTGAGIGLAISRRVAEALGGEITVSSEEGRGSTFTLWLPCIHLDPSDE